jgi:hypothetical protein
LKIWDLIFSRQWQFCLCSFGLNRRVDWLVEANVSEMHAISIFSAEMDTASFSKHCFLPFNPHGDLTEKNIFQIKCSCFRFSLIYVYAYPFWKQRNIFTDFLNVYYNELIKLTGNKKELTTVIVAIVFVFREHSRRVAKMNIVNFSNI